MNKKEINEKDINDLSFEDALEELEKITESFEDGDSTLENAVNLYNKGVLLKKHCEKKLKEAQDRIEKIEVGDDGEITASPIEISKE